MTLKAGTRLGHYRVVGLLGRGGMADVYRAADERLGREVALKALPEAFARDPDRVRRFEREVRAAAGLTHPGIVTVYEYGRGGGHHFFTMTLMPGGDLKSRVRATPGGLPEEEARDVAAAVASALDYAHNQGLVHRDVKPENVLFGQDGRPQLTDFGIARAISEGAGFTEEGKMIGSPHYVSPEQAQAGRVDGRSDLYSLGIVLYEMLTGGVPFDAPEAMAILYKHVYEAPAPLPGRVAGWQPMMDRLLAKAPEGRYPTANDLLAEIAPPVSWTGPHRVAPPVSAEVPQTPAVESVSPEPAPEAGGTRVVAAAPAKADPERGATPAQAQSRGERPSGGKAARETASAQPATVEPLRLAIERAWNLRADGAASRQRAIVLGLAVGALAIVVATLTWAGLAEPSEREVVAGGSSGPDRIPRPSSQGRSSTVPPDRGLASPLGSEVPSSPESPPDAIADGTPLNAGGAVAAFDSAPAESESAIRAAALEPPPRAPTGRTVASERPPPDSAPALPPHGLLEFEIVPPDATVVLEAENRRLSSGDSLLAGTHRLKIGREGYREVVRAVRVTEGGVVPVRVQLERVAEPTPLEAIRRTAVAEVPRRPPETPAERLGALDRPREPPGRDSAVLTERLRSGGAGPAMVVVPAGEFRMGCLNDKGGCRNEELPVRTVKVPSFALARREVTRGDFARFQTATGRDMGGGCRVYNGKDWIVERDRSWQDSGRDQVVCVTWEDAAAYAAWLSSETGERYRLPSEAEWEYVARRTRDFDVEHMVGSVWEWAADCWRPNYKQAPTDGSAVERRRCKDRVMRGGSWLNGPALQTPSYRLRILGEERFSNVGFRVARDVSR